MSKIREKIYKEIMEMLGLVPSMFKKVPDASLELEWQLFKRIQFDKGPIPNKYRELLGLAISGVTKCKYCIFYHTELAKLNGATEEEIEDAIHYAKASVGWSTYLSGLQFDFEKFKKEIVKACDYVKKKNKAKKTITTKKKVKMIPTKKTKVIVRVKPKITPKKRSRQKL